MSALRIYSATDEKSYQEFFEFADIEERLGNIGIKFERWNPKYKITKTASPEDILQAYTEQVSQIISAYGFKSVDVINMNSSIAPESVQSIRNKFLAEHTHSDDEVRYFIEGAGLFCIHHLNSVYQILCKAGDFIAVPAMTKHWFDMGAQPDFKCIRFFSDQSGWVAQYTGDSLAERYPLIEDFNNDI